MNLGNGAFQMAVRRNRHGQWETLIGTNAKWIGWQKVGNSMNLYDGQKQAAEIARAIAWQIIEETTEQRSNKWLIHQCVGVLIVVWLTTRLLGMW
jgi:hypothetical protein